MSKMELNNKECKDFVSQYKDEELELVVLFNDETCGSGRVNGDLFWTASAEFLAYQNTAAGEIENGNGSVVWVISDEEQELYGSSYPYSFKKESMYRLRVRELADRTVQDGRLPSLYNRFLIVEKLEEVFCNDALTNIFNEYRKPVVIEDNILGFFSLNKKHSCFKGRVEWLGENISVHMNVDNHNESSWHSAMDSLRFLYDNMAEKDHEFRCFAAENLTELANDWLEDSTSPEITTEDFIRRICLLEISVSADGSFSAYYNDDDMFYGHVITVSGDTLNGVEDATISG